MYRKCNSDKKVTFSRLSHKRLSLHIPNAADNVISYEIYPVPVGQKKPLKAKRLSTAMRLCTGKPETIADKLKYTRLSAGLHQNTLAEIIGVDRITLLRYENGQIEEKHMQTEWLIQIALVCGMDKYFCCSPYHVFLAEDAGKQIKQYRKARGLTVKAFAAELGVSTMTIKRWEKNIYKPSELVWEIVNEYNCSK